MVLKPNLNKHKAKVLMLFGLSIVGGVAIASFLAMPKLAGQLVFISAWILILVALYFWPKRHAAVFLILAGFILGGWRYQLAQEIGPGDLANYQNQDIELIGRVKTEPEIGDSYQKFVVAGEQLLDGQKIKGDAAIYAGLTEKYHYGDRLSLNCFLEKPMSLGDFDAAAYWRRFGVYGLCRFGEVKILATGQGNWFYAQVIKLRQAAARIIKANLAYPESDLGGAMVFGVGDKLSADLKNAFSQSGLTHIIAISGLNVSLLVGLLFGGSLFLGLSRRLSLWLSLLGISFFVVLVGAPASAVRAGVMGVLLLLAAWLGRLNKLINALVLAAAITLLSNPFLLKDDIGWQLSFLALLGIIYLYPLLRLVIKNSQPFVDFLLDCLSLTLAAQIATAPVIAMSFKQLSLVAPLANILAVWITPVIIVALFGALILSFLWPWWLWWLPVLLALKYLIAVAVLSARLPWATLAINQVNPIFLPLYYIILSLAVYCLNRFIKKKEKSIMSNDKSNFLW